MKTKLAAKEICLIGFFAAITAVTAQIAIPLPFTPIPISFGMVGIYMSGMFLRPSCAVLAQLCYLLIGAIGMPVFANFRGGVAAIVGPTGGFLMVYPLMAFIISFALNRQKSLQAESGQRKILKYLKAGAAISLALCVEYLGGAIWFMATTEISFYVALTKVCFPFVPLDIAKIVFTVFAILPLRARFLSANILAFGKNRAAPENHAVNNGSDAFLQRALAGEALSPADANILMDPARTPLDALIDTAGTITRRHFRNEISMCAIYPAKVGLCSNDCAFCAQSAHHDCDVVPVDVHALNEDEIIENARKLWHHGVRRYSLVTSGEHLTDAEFARILGIFKRLRNETDMGLCASLGSLTPERAQRLLEAGVSRYHHNIETSRSFFPEICSTHSYDDKIATIDIAKKAGMEICCGGILALGETPAQRIEMAFALKALDIDCVPLNILNPISGTRLAHQKPLLADEILRTIAVFRLILPDKVLRFAGGREKALGPEEYKGYTAGINAMLVGNYLTTNGTPVEEELKNLKAAGFCLSDA